MIIALAALVIPCRADRRPKKKDLEKQVEALQYTLDSLQNVVDSLAERRIDDDAVIAALEGNSAEADEGIYPDEVSDSLVDKWYNAQRIHDYDAQYDMNTVHFTSKVSDEEMVRRLKAMNSYITLPFNETVKNYMILYSEKMPTKMSRMLGFSQYYMPIFEEVFAKYGLPVELKYMAVIESALNPVARSRVGALGMWQFMYRTARGYGLQIDSFVDERLDVEKAADAAARYLRDSYEVFGDWPLAISSYNCGAGNVQKAIRRAGSKDFWAVYDYLPRETRGYVPAFVGAMYAFTYYKEYGIKPADVGMPAVCDTFEIHKNLHFRQINEVVGVPMETLHQHNPQYIKDIIPGNDKTYILNLPYSWSNAFMAANNDSLYKYKADKLMSEQVLKDIKTHRPATTAPQQTRIAYKVKKGDYLGRIASRNGVTISQLKKWNHLRSDTVRVGQILYIYKRGAAPTASKSSGSTTAKSKSASTASKPAYVTYTVRSGDTLSKIAARYHTTVKKIMDANGLRSTKIQSGKKLKIPTK